ncbi:MAG: cupin domain-containing protein [Desulfobacteraceae bacterium]|nr:cupin domain-containing protein [Desulfobacteraceae bacterium]
MDNKHVGKRIRILRRARGMTLQQVAAQTGLTASFLSQMERSLTGITLSSLASVSNALGVQLRELVTQPDQTTPDTHQGERQEYSVESVSLHYERLSTSFPGSCLHSLKIRIPAGYSSGFESHAGEELLFVLSGSIEYTVDGQTFHLGTGDSVHIDSRRSHQIVNTSDTTTEILWTSTLPVFEDGVQTSE